MSEPTYTKEQLRNSARDGWNLAIFALAQMERAENAEKRMKAWGCPDEDFICLNCGRETPCMTEADLKPGDPGVPCTFDLTYPQMIERIHYHEDQQRRAEAERDRLKGELEEAEEAIRSLLLLPQCKPITGEAVICVACGQRKAPIGRDAPSVLYLCDHECVGYKDDPRPGFLWPGETLEDFGYPEDAARADGDLREALKQPAVRRARERGGRGGEPRDK